MLAMLLIALVPLPPLAGALAIGVGVILLIKNVRKPVLAGARS
jgi:hypothetical protein